IPPTTFGVVFVVQSSRPGSTRSGDIARWKSWPAFRPDPSSSSGSSTSRVVPGHVVDSRITVWPRCSTGARLLAAFSMYERFGLPPAGGGGGGGGDDTARCLPPLCSE